MNRVGLVPSVGVLELKTAPRSRCDCALFSCFGATRRAVPLLGVEKITRCGAGVNDCSHVNKIKDPNRGNRNRFSKARRIGMWGNGSPLPHTN